MIFAVLFIIALIFFPDISFFGIILFTVYLLSSLAGEIKEDVFQARSSRSRTL